MSFSRSFIVIAIIQENTPIACTLSQIFMNAGISCAAKRWCRRHLNGNDLCKPSVNSYPRV
ncbi:hypothetical protein SISNIDRAFT_459233 [Sistotremastrum niveocremeum HHB9708]|uniref:Uncharacterized protein n=1 Tax=Sistotremastrum niveocremeum HHB9708 TaxID=1314777 RepID=A0A164PT48_9AGAM|nr:hypothetical protein SISNIDRAFT_459233 [Sistotremastrum niveocremeum HHB9708]